MRLRVSTDHSLLTAFVGYIMGVSKVVTGLRVGLGVEGVKPSLPKNVPVQTLQFDKLWLHHASGQFPPLSHEQPLHFELVLLVVVSGSISGSVGGGAPHDVVSQRHVSAVAYSENV